MLEPVVEQLSQWFNELLGGLPVHNLAVVRREDLTIVAAASGSNHRMRTYRPRKMSWPTTC